MTEAHTKLPGSALQAIRSRRFVAFITAMFLLASQVVLQQHVHADAEGLGSDCVICVHSDHTPVSLAPPGLFVPQGVEVWAPAPQPLALPKRILRGQHARAPPVS